jgi:methanogenic corrinoid protein MtbC1
MWWLGIPTTNHKEDTVSQEVLEELAQAVIDGEPEDAEEVAQKALAMGLDPLVCINQGLTPGIDRVGELFATGEYYLPDLILGGDAMKAALVVLEPALTNTQGRDIRGRVVLGTVEGDLHEIGKTLVGTMLTANGFQVTDIGVDKPAADFVAAVKANQATLVGASALLTTTMLHQRELIEALQGDDRRRACHAELGRQDRRRRVCRGCHLRGRAGQAACGRRVVSCA